MAEEKAGMYETSDNSEVFYPLTNCNFIVTVVGQGGTAAFTSIGSIGSSVQEITFRQGNSDSLAPVKIPGLVSHGAVTLSMGYTLNNGFKNWVKDCVSEQRKALPRYNVQIELIDTNKGAPQKKLGDTQQEAEKGRIWILKNAWVSQYNGPDLDANNASVAMESVSISYEELTIPN